MKSRALAVAALWSALGLGCGGEATPRESTSSSESLNPRETAAWWIERHGVLAENDPRTHRARAVFERLAAATERRSARQPQLVLLAGDGEPFGLALRDGSILLTRGAFDLCYRERSLEDGDARLAFVLGHELAHLSESHFDHELAFSAADRAGVAQAGASGDGVLGRILRGRRELDATREFEADTSGLLAMTFAGYDPWVLLGEKSFFAEWVDQAGGRKGEIDGRSGRGGHPSPEERAGYLIVQLADVARQIPLFHFGTRLVQAGRLDDGALLLERFAERFPSREVLSNLGVAQARMALRALGRCDGALISRLRVPLLLDQRTLAERTIRRGATSPCYEREDVRRPFTRAITRLEAAVERDPSYVPAALNLIAAYLLFDQPGAALTLAQEALKRSPDDLDLQTAEAVSLYAFGARTGLDSADRALTKIDSVLARDSRHAVALYDRAAILGERGRSAAAEEAWRRFLEVEPVGKWADTARAWLGEAPPEKPASPTHSIDPVLEREPRLGAGPISSEVLAQTRREPFHIGDLEIETLSGPLISVLRLGNSTELVETAEAWSDQEALTRFGDPLEIESTPLAELWIYPGFAVEFDDTKTTLIRFAAARERG